MIIVKIYLGILGAVVDSVGSVQFQIVPFSSLYFLKSIGLFLCSRSNYRVLIYCTCHFQSDSLCLFWLLLFAGLFSV